MKYIVFIFIFFTILNANNNNLTKKEKRKESTLILTNSEKIYLNKKQNIKMCVDPDWMPFEKIHNKKHVGIAADYIKLFQDKLGVPIDLIETKSWSQSLEYAKNRNCDILSLAMSTPSRERYMNFTKPYMEIPLVLVTKKEITFFTDLKQLSHKTIGIQKDFAFSELFKRKYPNINIIDVKNLQEGFNKVERGELFGQISTNISAAHLFQNQFAGTLQISGKFDENYKLSIAVRNDDLILYDIFEKTVVSLTENSKQKIINNWINIKYEKNFDFKIFAMILLIILIVLIILIFILYKQHLLKKHNIELQIAKEVIQALNATLERRVEKRTRALQEKTLELEELNNTLDYKIKEEILKREKQEKLLIQQSKLAEMGEMISMIAHQWRQPLSALSIIIQNIHLCHSLGKLNSSYLDKQLKLGNALTDKMSKTINDFRDFFKPNKKRTDFSIHSAIQQTIFLVDDSLRYNNIEIKREMKDDVIIHGYGNELAQVILNIISNSRDALLENSIENPYIKISVEKRKDSGIICISDNAGGIKETIINKIFEPYFTTKDTHNGTGLGLYMSKMIIEQNMKGKLTVENIPDGTQFCVEVPKKSI